MRAKRHLVVLHGNGFTGATHANLARVLADHDPQLAVWLVDLRGHGLSTLEADPARMDDYDLYRADVAGFVGQLKGPVHLLGFSLGALLCLSYAEHAPQHVASLMVLEPSLLPLLTAWSFELTQKIPGLTSRLHPLGLQARKRRARWPTWDDLASSYLRKSLFRRFDVDCLAGYLATGIQSDEQGVRLTCDPVWEAHTFEQLDFSVWRAVLRNRETKKLPVFLAWGQQAGSTFSLARAKQFRKHFLALEEHAYADADHFLPMTHVEQLSQQVLGFYAVNANRPYSKT